MEEVSDLEKAHLRVEGNGGERHRLEESALDRVGMSGGSHRLEEGALDRVGMVWRRELPTGRERTREWKGMGDRDEDWKRAHLIGWEWCGGGRHRLGESALESGRE